MIAEQMKNDKETLVEAGSEVKSGIPFLVVKKRPGKLRLAIASISVIIPYEC